MEVYDHPDVVTEKREDIYLASSVPEVMAGSFCRDQEIVNIMEVKPDESAFFIRLKDGTEEWVDNAELDETTKEFFKLSKPVKVALNMDSEREDIKIHHIWTNIIHKISTYGISSIEELKMRYIQNTKNALSVDLCYKDDAGNLVSLSPETILPIKATKLFARDIVVSDRARSIDNSTEYWFLGHPFQLKEGLNNEGGKHWPDQEVHEVQGKQDDLKIEHRGLSYVPEVEKLQDNVTDSVCSKMSLQQRTELAKKISKGTLTYGELYEAIRATQAHGLDARFKTMITSLVGSSKPEWEDKALELIENADQWLGNNKAKELISNREMPLQALDEGKKERNRLTSTNDREESVDDVPTEQHNSFEDLASQSVIILSKPNLRETSPSRREWLTSLSKKPVADIIEEVQLKIADIENKCSLKIAEIENKNRTLVDDLKSVIRKQASEKNDLSEIMKRNKQSLLRAIDTELTEVNKKFEERYESFFEQRQEKIKSNGNLELVQPIHYEDPVKAGEGAVSKKSGKAKLTDAMQEKGQPSANIPAPPINGCKGKHILKRKVGDEIDVCDLCEAKVDYDVFSCQRCNFSICGVCMNDVTEKADPQSASEIGRAIDSNKQVGQPFVFRDIVKQEKFQTVVRLLPSSFPRKKVLSTLAKHKWNLQQTVNELLTQNVEPISQNTFYYC